MQGGRTTREAAPGFGAGEKGGTSACLGLSCGHGEAHLGSILETI